MISMSEKYKHLTLSDRISIEAGLKATKTLNELSNIIGKSPRTISYEIKTHLIRKENSRYKFSGNPKTYCQRHKRYPFTCDGCALKTSCLSDFHSYEAKLADQTYQHTLKTSRQGINLSATEYGYLDDIVKKGIKKGQSLEHIKATHPDLPISVRSLYRYVDQDILSTKSFDLRCKVRLKKRKKPTKIAQRAHIAGRQFMDYLEFCAKHPQTFTIEMDTVHGAKSDTQYLLTFILIEFHFFYACVIPKNAGAVTRSFKWLYETLGHDDFNRLFPVILTDRGTEFSEPEELEFNMYNQRRTHVFYCDPLASYQKGAIESIHRLLRYVFPKGKSLDHLTQDKLQSFINAINSYKLRSNQFIPAYQMMETHFGKDLLEKLKVKAIDPDFIHLTPDLVR
jgi:transposase, IS30 family